MRPIRAQALAAALAVALLAASPAGRAATFSALGYSAPVPSTWAAQPPSSQYRLAQYSVAGSGGEAEAIVFFFGKGQGGSAAANIQRWASQFTTAEGRPVQPKTQVLMVADLPVTLVELNGSYARGMGSGPQGAAKPNQMLLVAIIETPGGNVTIQLHGPQATVAANRKGFDAMVRGFRKAT